MRCSRQQAGRRRAPAQPRAAVVFFSGLLRSFQLFHSRLQLLEAVLKAGAGDLVQALLRVLEHLIQVAQLGRVLTQQRGVPLVRSQLLLHAAHAHAEVIQAGRVAQGGATGGVVAVVVGWCLSQVLGQVGGQLSQLRQDAHRVRQAGQAGHGRPQALGEVAQWHRDGWAVCRWQSRLFRSLAASAVLVYNNRATDWERAC